MTIRAVWEKPGEHEVSLSLDRNYQDDTVTVRAEIYDEFRQVTLDRADFVELLRMVGLGPT